MSDDDQLRTYAIYKHPSDYPNHYVVRGFTSHAGATVPDHVCKLADSLDQARTFIPRGLLRLIPKGGDPVIVEEYV